MGKVSVHYHVVDKASWYPAAYKYLSTAERIAQRDKKDVMLCSSQECIGRSIFNYSRIENACA